MNIKELAKEQEEYIIAARRHLHAHPEVGTEEKETTAYIVSELEKIDGVEIHTYEDITGCLATIKGGKPGKTVMLRADIDALPITEQTGLPYCSLNPGAMHACGHDCHTAMLLGAARILAAHRDELEGDVKLIFQMGEEIGRLSEQYVIRGALEGVDAIYGAHVWPTLPSGTFNVEYGDRMACSDRFTIHVHGVSAHGSAPELGKDAILAAAAVVQGLQHIVSRMNNPRHPLVVTTGMMNGGTKENILADEVELVGTVRTFDREFRNSMPERIENVAKGVAAGYGCTADCTYYFGPSPLINDHKDLVKIGRKAAAELFGKENLVHSERVMGAEDFSVYTESIPGLYGYLGTGNHELGTDGPNHNPHFTVDESVLYLGTAMYVKFAQDYLKAET